jgi:hypothetical protein
MAHSLPRVMLALLGFAPIGALCIALFGLVPLHVSARWLVLPAAVLAVAIGWRHPRWGRVALVGFVAGMGATAVYDVLRLALVAVGVWPDFIPPIGQLALQDPGAHPVWGYVWRFFGNGGGMGMTFALLPWRSVRAGMIYGVGICVCLYVTLLFGPGVQERLFPLTAVTAAAAMAGHLDYGAVLGWLVKRWLPGPAIAPQTDRLPVADSGNVTAC